jgi:type III pantothenate kinase
MADIVVDIGNSRMKWGRVDGGGVATAVSLPLDDLVAWERQRAEWRLTGSLHWVVAGVRPRTQDTLLTWLKSHGDTARLLDRAAELPLIVKLPEPDKVGIDRLLAAVGANSRRAVNPNSAAQGAIVVGVGTAITVDLIDTEGVFLGGAIMPGPRLMALSLHEHTALLPLVETIPPWPSAPATATRPAIELGIHWAMVGGINGLIREMGARVACEPEAMDIFVTGGGAALVIHRLIGRTHYCPELVLEGICLTARSLS